MKNINSYFIKICVSSLIILFVSACSMHWTDAVKKGEIVQNNFSETVAIEVENGLIFLPVSINGKEYKFLFDSGAPLSISEQLQSELNYKVISEGTIKDSDHNKKAVNWVQIEALSIGVIDFKNQSAFVGDFQANPILKCLNFDGIIGSNIMRQCNWTIDQQNMTLTLSDNSSFARNESSVVIPFRSDNQFNMFIDLKMGRASIKNVLIDYGSSAGVSFTNSVMNTLKENAIVENTVSLIGYQQGGIVGKAVKSNREYTRTDSLNLNNYRPKEVQLRTGKTVSIGNKFLSRFDVTINWDKKQLYLDEKITDLPPFETAGFTLGYSEKNGVYVQSVFENSNAYNAGVRPLMQVTTLNELNFETDADYCDYIANQPKSDISLEILNSEGKKQSFQFERTQIKY